jgi:hypothetical protein
LLANEDYGFGEGKFSVFGRFLGAGEKARQTWCFENELK